MAANTRPIFPVAVMLGMADLTAATPITARTNIVGTTGLVKLTDPIANNPDGIRVDAIRIKCKGVSVAGLISIWVYDGTTSRLVDEFEIAAITPTATVVSFSSDRQYSTLNLMPGQQLYVSETVVNDATVFALGGKF